MGLSGEQEEEFVSSQLHLVQLLTLYRGCIRVNVHEPYRILSVYGSITGFDQATEEECKEGRDEEGC